MSARAPQAVAGKRAGGALEVAPSCLGIGLPSLRAAARRFGEIEHCARGPALATAAENEELVDRVRQPVDLGDRGVELVRRRTRSQRLGLLQPQTQTRERRPELVRGIGDEVALGTEQP